jgi:hypothetical protein
MTDLRIFYRDGIVCPWGQLLARSASLFWDEKEEKLHRDQKDDNCQREKGNAEAAIDGVSPQPREISGINGSGSPGFPNSASNKRIVAKRFSLELKSWSTRSAWVLMLRTSRNLKNRSEKEFCSCITQTISSLLISSAVHAVIGLLSNKVTRGEKRDGGFFTVFGDDGEFSAAGLKIEDGVSGPPCEKKACFGFNWWVFVPSQHLSEMRQRQTLSVLTQSSEWSLPEGGRTRQQSKW